MTGRLRPDALEIRPAEPSDLDALLRLENEAFANDRLDRRALRHAIGSRTILALVASGAGGAVTGYALVQLRRGSKIGRLTSVAVAPGSSGRGFGRSLVLAAEAASREAGCDRMRLEVRADNRPARRLYQSAGYEAGRSVPDYYEDGETALRFEKRLG